MHVCAVKTLLMNVIVIGSYSNADITCAPCFWDVIKRKEETGQVLTCLICADPIPIITQSAVRFDKALLQNAQDEAHPCLHAFLGTIDHVPCIHLCVYILLLSS